MCADAFYSNHESGQAGVFLKLFFMIVFAFWNYPGQADVLYLFVLVFLFILLLLLSEIILAMLV